MDAPRRDWRGARKGRREKEGNVQEDLKIENRHKKRTLQRTRQQAMKGTKRVGEEGKDEKKEAQEERETGLLIGKFLPCQSPDSAVAKETA